MRKIKNEELCLNVPLKYKPRNELETIILFSLLPKKLGYTIVKAQNEYPDLIIKKKVKR